jgi:hypothetical protein
LVAKLSAVTRGRPVGFDGSAVLTASFGAGGLTSFSDDRFRRSLALSGSSICFDFPLTTRNERFVPERFFFAEARADGFDFWDFGRLRALALSLRFGLCPPNASPPGFTSRCRETQTLELA